MPFIYVVYSLSQNTPKWGSFMKKWFENIRFKTQQWMQGRYGFDELSRTLYYISLAFFIFSLFSPSNILYYPAVFLVLWSCIRCYSKDHAKRLQEREVYLRLIGKTKGWFRLQQDKWKDRKSYRYFRCKQCKATLIVPKGKGKICIHCPKCHNELRAKT